MKHLPIVERQYGRIKATFDRFEFNGRIACYVECLINKKVSKPRGGFEMKEFTFNGNSIHVSTNDFLEIPDYASNPFSPPFVEIFKDFGIEPISRYDHFIY